MKNQTVKSQNDPFGNIQPGKSDQKIMDKIRDCSLILDVALPDHIISGDDKYSSFADKGSL